MNRWRRFLCVAVLCALPALAFGFDFGFGFKVGMNFPYWGGIGFDESLLLLDSDNFVMTVGAPGGIPPVRFCFSGGFFLDFGLLPWLAIQPEVLYSMLGTGYNAGGEDKYYAHVSAIEVPILVRFRIFTTKGGGLSLFLGPDVMFPLGAQVSARYSDGGEDSSDVVWYWKGNFQKYMVSFGAVAGLGFHFSNGTFIEGRYYLGAFSANENFDWSTFSLSTLDPANRTWAQNNIQVLLGFEI